jgi:hypothetical protein
MLEETRVDYALVTVFVEVWISIGSCRRLLLDHELTGSYSGPEVLECCIESAQTHRARACALPARASDTTLGLPGTYPHDARLDYFRIADNLSRIVAPASRAVWSIVVAPMALIPARKFGLFVRS